MELLDQNFTQIYVRNSTINRPLEISRKTLLNPNNCFLQKFLIFTTRIHLPKNNLWVMSINIFPKQVHNLLLCFDVRQVYEESSKLCKALSWSIFQCGGLQALMSGNELKCNARFNSQEIYFLLYLICE
jgi:hypothetical protein